MTLSLPTLLDNLRQMSDDELSTFLASNPDIFKKAQKALQEAKRKELEIATRKNEKAASAAGLVFDLKSWTRARRLVTEPFNEVNAAELASMLAKTDPRSTPENEKSLMCYALDYLSEKQRVSMDWPWVLASAGAPMGLPEIESFIRLLSKRSSLNDAGPNARELFLRSLGQDLEWGVFETTLKGSKVVPTGLVDLLDHHCFSAYGSQNAKDPQCWRALENLARAGCAPPSIKDDPSNFRHGGRPWQNMASQQTDGPEASEAKVAAFEAMIELGWCDKGQVALNDNLSPRSAGGADRKGQKDYLTDCGSRASIHFLPFAPSSMEIFAMLCEREQRMGFERYDEVGRSRLFLLNERLRRQGSNPAGIKVVLAMAQRAMDLGDPPESVNGQNPLAKCADQNLAEIVHAAIELRELGGVSAGSSAARKRSSSI